MKWMTDFDYHAPAELFSAAGRGFCRHPMQYRRFDTGAQAVRYAIETLPAALLPGSVIQTDDDRFDAQQIRQLYRFLDLPLSGIS